MVIQSGPRAVLRAAVSGVAVPLTVSPLAMPIRRVPKSNDRIKRARRSGMTGGQADPGGVNAEGLPGCLPAFLIRQLEHDALIHRHRKPGIVENLALELPG